VLLRKAMLPRLDQAGPRDRSRDERDTDGLERARGKRLRRDAGPEAVAIAGDGDEAGETLVADEIVDLGALDVRGAVVSAPDAGAHGARPRPPRSAPEGLRVGAKVERALRVAPDLPRRTRRREALLEPLLLLGAEDRLRRCIAPRVRDILAVEADRLRPLGVRAARVEDPHHF